jgi:hypothetical protein
MTPFPLRRRRPVPALDLPLVGGGRHVLGASPGTAFDLIVFCRGLHCPICAKSPLELERLAPEYARRGVQVVIVRPDGTLYYRAVQTMPFARPSFQDLLGAIDFALAHAYAAHGEFTGDP